jgi:hypothetical protein
VQGLGLRDFTEVGWADSNDGRMHVGVGEHSITEREPWRSDKELLTSIAESLAASMAAESAASGLEPSGQFISNSVDAEAQLVQNVTLRGDGASGGLQAGVARRQMRAATGDIDFEGDAETQYRKSVSRVVQGDECWWSPKGMSCKDYYSSFTSPDGTVVPGGQGRSGVEGSKAPEPAAPVAVPDQVQPLPALQVPRQQSIPPTSQYEGPVATKAWGEKRVQRQGQGQTRAPPQRTSERTRRVLKPVPAPLQKQGVPEQQWLAGELGHNRGMSPLSFFFSFSCFCIVVGARVEPTAGWLSLYVLARRLLALWTVSATVEGWLGLGTASERKNLFFC